MSTTELLEKLFDGWGTSDAYGNETLFLHESEIEKIAAELRAVSRGDSEKYSRGWPTNAEARRAFHPIYEAGDTPADFANVWRDLDVEKPGNRGLDSPRAERAKLVLMIATSVALIDEQDD